jgi:hypothetical protein
MDRCEDTVGKEQGNAKLAELNMARETISTFEEKVNRLEESSLWQFMT